MKKPVHAIYVLFQGDRSAGEFDYALEMRSVVPTNPILDPNIQGDDRDTDEQWKDYVEAFRERLAQLFDEFVDDAPIINFDSDTYEIEEMPAPSPDIVEAEIIDLEPKRGR